MEFTPIAAQQIFFCLSEINRAREELKKNPRFSQIIYFNFYPDLRKIFPK